MEERIPKLGVAVGKKNVGKTHETTQTIHKYMMGNQALQKWGKKVLVMDINGEYRFPTLDYRNTKTFSDPRYPIEIRRIPPIHPKTGKVMTSEEFVQVLFHVLHSFRGGMLLLEDINGYVGDNMPGDLISLVTRCRHFDLDIMIHYQSMAAVQTKVWRNLNYLRLHKTTDSVASIKDKFPDRYEMFQIAEIIVNTAYPINKYFHLFIDLDHDKIRSASGHLITNEMKEAALNKYIEQYDNTTINRLVKSKDDHGKARFDHGSARMQRRTELFKSHF